MTSNTLSFETISSLVADIHEAIELMASIPHCNDHLLQEYKEICAAVPDHINSDHLKVAVVGVIKSGKSTFINSLAKKEVVKRGAGTMTAITTRIRKGTKNRAIISFKNWDQVNQTLDNILDMFPWEKPESRFDLRRQKDREYLGQVFDSFKHDFPITDQGLRPEALMVRNALEGYETCRTVVQADEVQISFSGKEFQRHQTFTADPAAAFYLKDVCLEVYGKTIDPGIEIADCQGADSTDPAQLSQILSYLRSANLIVYCISSRTGLRQSDIAFLKTIQRLGLMGNVLFVNNCDLSEHENIDDLKRIEAGIIRELGYLVPEPSVFSFSALFNLFESISQRSERNTRRMELWNSDAKMAGYSRESTQEFGKVYQNLLDTRRYQLLYANHLERLRLTTRALAEKCDLVEGILTADMADQDAIRGKLSGIEENAKRLRLIVDNSIQGAVGGLSREIEDNLKTAFSKGGENIMQKVGAFISTAKLDVNPYRSGVKETGFKQILYLMFQDFKRKLDLYALEEILPEILQLASTQEKRIEVYFQSLLDSYQIDLPALDSLSEAQSAIFVSQTPPPVKAIDIQEIKKILGLSLPEQVFSLEYTAKIKANALTDLSLHSFFLFLSALFDKKARFSFTPGFNKAAAKIKKESLASVRQQIRSFHQRLNHTYFSPLIEAVTRDFKDKILNRFSLYDSLGRDVEEIFRLKQEEKEVQQENLHQAGERLARVLEKLEGLSATAGLIQS